MTVDVAKPINPRQLARELADRQGHDNPPPIRGRIDRDTNTIVRVGAGAGVDDDELRAAVDEHQAVWPEPPPDPIDVLADGVQAAQTLKDLRGALGLLPEILRDLRERRER